MHAHLTTCRLLLVQPLWPHALAAGADALKECVTTCVSYVALFKVVSSIVMHAPLQNTGTLSTSTAARLRQAGLWRERGFRPPREALPSVLSCTSRWPQSGGARSPCARGRSIDIPEHYRHSRASSKVELFLGGDGDRTFQSIIDIPEHLPKVELFLRGDGDRPVSTATGSHQWMRSSGFLAGRSASLTSTAPSSV